MEFSSPFLGPPQSLGALCSLLHAHAEMDPAVAVRMCKVDGCALVDGWPVSMWVVAVCFEMLRQETNQFEHAGKCLHEERARQLYLATRRLPLDMLSVASLTQKSQCLVGFPTHPGGLGPLSHLKVGLLDSPGDLGLWLPWVLLDGFFSCNQWQGSDPNIVRAFFRAWKQMWTRAQDIALSGVLPGLSVFTENDEFAKDFWLHIDLLPLEAQPSLWCRLQLWQPGGAVEDSWWKEGFDNWSPKGPMSWPHVLFEEVMSTMEREFGPVVAANYRQIHDQALSGVQGRSMQSATPLAALACSGVRL